MIYLDYSKNYQLLFQDPASPMMNGIIDLHHYIMFFLCVILTFVVVLLITVVELFIVKQTVKHISYLVVHTVQDISAMFKSISEKERLEIMEKLRIDVRVREEDFKEKRKIALSAQNNLFWTNLYAQAGVISQYFIVSKANNKSVFDVNLLTNTGTGESVLVDYINLFSSIERYKYSNVRFQSQYLSNILLGATNYSSSLPNIAVKYATKQVNEVALASLAIVNVYQAYALNLYYWMQIYFTLRSGINNFTHSTVIEIVWTILPSLILICIGVPSFILLYAMDEIIEPDLVVKCIGHQWYWSYEIEYPNYFYHMSKEVYDLEFTKLYKYAYSWPEDILLRSLVDIKFNKEPYIDFGRIKLQNIHWGYLNFNSYMIPENELKIGTPRLLEVDNPLFLPVKTHIDLLVTANDVLHCWTVPSFGVKMDAVPGRINHANIFIERSGTFYGQCSEICGVNHGFMPIKVIAVSLREFLTNVNNN